MPSASVTMYTNDDKTPQIYLVEGSCAKFPWVKINFGNLAQKTDVALFFQSEADLRLWIEELRQQVASLCGGNK